jgi:CO/xanthine dehydrogenase FAD-binding subunit
VKPPAFSYVRAGTPEEAVALLARHGGEAKALAGGQSLVPLMNFRLARPGVLVDIGRLDTLAYVSERDGALAIGALTRQAAVEDSPLAARRCPLLVEATRLVGHRPIRNRGTVGGSLAHADPAAEYPAVLLALEGEVTARGPRGERVIPAARLFRSVFATSLEPDELLTEVRLPAAPPRSGAAFVELSRRHGDYAIVGVAAVVALDSAGRCREARLALAGVAGTPVRCAEAEQLLQGTSGEEAVLDEAGRRCAASVEPRGDLHASPAYRKAMVAVFVRRALRLAFRRATGGS